MTENKPETRTQITRSWAFLACIGLAMMAATTVGTWAYRNGVSELGVYALGGAVYLICAGSLIALINSREVVADAR